jgi:chaperonin GroEL
LLADIAVTTGGQVISEEVGLKLENTELAQLGKADRVIATKDSTTVVGGAGKKEAIADRVGALKADSSSRLSIQSTTKKKLEERIAKLSGGVAVHSRRRSN